MSEHTPGAMKAARSIMVEYKFLDLPVTANAMAKIIDKGMQAPTLIRQRDELMKALENLVAHVKLIDKAESKPLLEAEIQISLCKEPT